MSMLEFNDPIAVDTPCGKGYAVFVEASAHDNWWTVAISETQAVVTFPQNKIRVHRSYTHGRGISDEQMRKITSTTAPAKTARC